MNTYIYILFTDGGDVDTTELLGAFTTRDKAEAARDSYEAKYNNDATCWITEATLDKELL